MRLDSETRLIACFRAQLRAERERDLAAMRAETAHLRAIRDELLAALSAFRGMRSDIEKRHVDIEVERDGKTTH